MRGRAVLLGSPHSCKAALLGAALALTTPLTAQEQTKPPVLSPSCGVPMTRLAAPAPLPHLTAALKDKTTIHIVAIGSSSTFGIGASTLDKTYPFQLQDILEKSFQGRDVYISNSGTSGELAAATAERVKNEVALKQPDLVLWQVGTNDVLAGVPVEDFRATVQSTIRWLKDHGIDTALIGLQYSPAVEKDERHKAIGQVIREVASAENVLLVRRYDAMEFLANFKLEELLSDDELHQNDLGYRCMAEHVARAVIVSAFPLSPDAPQREQASRAQPR